MKRAKRITFGILTALLVLMCAAAAFLGLVLHGVSKRMHTPELASEPQVAGDVLYRT